MIKYIILALLIPGLSPAAEIPEDKLLQVANTIINDTGKYDKRIELLKLEIKNKPSELMPRIKIARLLVLKEKPLLASKFLRPGVMHNKNDWRGWFWLGTVSFAQNYLNYASKMMDAAIKTSNNESYWPYLQKAIILQEQGKWEDSLEYLYLANLSSKDNPTILLNIGYSAERCGQNETMLTAYDKFLKLTTNTPKFAGARSAIGKTVSGF